MKKIIIALLFSSITIFNLAGNEKNWFTDKFPSQLVNAKKQEVESNDALRGKMIAIYFSASWCPPCRSFTPQLVKFYKRTAKKNDLEIILVSFDRSENYMFDYMKKYKMPWLAVPFNDPARAKLKAQFKVRGIPALIVLDSNGKVITHNGTADVTRQKEKAAKAWTAKNK